MEVILKYAASLDGYLNDNTNDRYIFSSFADLEEVDKLRSRADAILVGAETLRKDNPSLKVKSNDNIKKRLEENIPAQPIRLCVSQSSNLSNQLKFFDNSIDSYLISPTVKENLKKYQIKATEKLDAYEIISLVSKLGVKRLLVEGGVKIHQLFLKSKLPLKLRVSIAPIFLGKKGVDHMKVSEELKLKLLDQQRLDNNIILWFNR